MARPNKSAAQADSKPLSPEVKRRLDTEKLQALSQLSAAMQIVGLMDKAGNMACPSGKSSHNNKLKVFTDEYNTTVGDEEVTAEVGKLNCHGCGRQWSPIDLVTEQLGKPFRDAVLILNGKPDRTGFKPEIDLDAVKIKEAEKVELTEEVFAIYKRFWELCDLKAAQEFYSSFGILPEVVKELGFKYLTDPVGVAKAMNTEFGQEALLKSGLVVMSKHDKPVYLANSQYPVIETYIYPDGKVSGFQFRASHATSKKVKAYNAYQAEVKERKLELASQKGINLTSVKGEMSAREFKELDDKLTREAKGALNKAEVEYIPKFMSIRGAGVASRVGFGLQRLAQLPEGSTVWVVEGGKNTAAGRSAGLETVGFPGSKFPPVRAVSYLLARHNLKNAYDPDEGGDEGRKKHVSHMAQFGVEYSSATFKTKYEGDETERELIFDKVEASESKEAQGVKRWRESNNLTATHYRNKEGLDIAELLEKRINEKTQES